MKNLFRFYHFKKFSLTLIFLRYFRKNSKKCIIKQKLKLSDNNFGDYIVLKISKNIKKRTLCTNLVLTIPQNLQWILQQINLQHCN